MSAGVIKSYQKYSNNFDSYYSYYCEAIKITMFTVILFTPSVWFIIVNVSKCASVIYRTLTGRLTRNKERADMLWSRLRIVDDRLAHVEVKYLSQELTRYQKTNEDLNQNLKLIELSDDIEVNEQNIAIQQNNHGKCHYH